MSPSLPDKALSLEDARRITDAIWGGNASKEVPGGEVCVCGPKQYCHLNNCQGVDGQTDRCGMNGCVLPDTHIGYCERQALIPCTTVGCQFSCDSLAEMAVHTGEAS